jgi:5-methylcytosine-specific restriction enzyme subunit McrC
MAVATVQVFEHQELWVGELLRTPAGGRHELTWAHHRALARFADSTKDRYLSCGRRSVRLSAYVGLIQLGDLAIEILPKADRGDEGGHGHWHRALIHMLRTVGDLPIEAPEEAGLERAPGRLFDLFVARFLGEIERLLHQGLAKAYRTEAGNRTTFRGRLVVAPHVRSNAANAARFYVESPVFDTRSLPNLVLHEALLRLSELPISPALRQRGEGLVTGFGELPRWRPDRAAVDGLRLTRNTARYASALRLAVLILFELSTNLHQGAAPLLALLFDMNLLWERYVAALARRCVRPPLRVDAQTSTPFWRGAGPLRNLRPDIVLRAHAADEVHLVLDTKWKVPRAGQPSMADLQQMFCYHERFACARSVLLYPSRDASTYIAGGGRYEGTHHRCATGFLSLQGDPRANLEGLIREALAGP